MSLVHGRLRARHSATSPSEALDTSNSAEPLQSQRLIMRLAVDVSLM